MPRSELQILHESDDPRYRLGLARTSSILAGMLAHAGLDEQAQAAAEDAARIYAELDPDDHSPICAKS